MSELKNNGIVLVYAIFDMPKVHNIIDTVKINLDSLKDKYADENTPECTKEVNILLENMVSDLKECVIKHKNC